MGFIRNLLRNREKQGLEGGLLKDPSPADFLRLARIYQEEGDLARARQIAKRGAAKFPDSAEIGSAEQGLARLDRQAECKRLRDQIDRYPNPRLYSRLAELLRADGKADEAHSTVSRGLRNYPDYGGLHYILGLLARDGGKTDEACEHLARATELDSYNYQALRILGQVQTELGRSAEAAAAYAKILAFAPDDEEVKALREKALAAGGGEKRAVSPTKDTKVIPTEEAVVGMARAAVEEGAGTELDVSLSELVGSAGIEGALLVDNYGLPVAAALPGGMEQALAAAMVTGLRRSASPACGEMGLGAFEELVVESSSGAVYVYALREMTLAVFTVAGAKAGMVERRAQSFAEQALDLH